MDLVKRPLEDAEPSPQPTKRVKRHEDPEVDQLLDQILARHSVCRDTIESAKALGRVGEQGVHALGPTRACIKDGPLSLFLELGWCCILKFPSLSASLFKYGLAVTPSGPANDMWVDIAETIGKVVAETRPEFLVTRLLVWKTWVDAYAALWTDLVGQLMAQSERMHALLARFEVEDMARLDQQPTGTSVKLVVPLTQLHGGVSLKHAWTGDEASAQALLDALPFLYAGGKGSLYL
jgi:hypothetical protein